MGIEADRKDWGGNTPLHRAVCQSHTDMVKMLLAGDALSENGSSVNKCSPNTTNEAGQTPL